MIKRLSIPIYDAEYWLYIADYEGGMKKPPKRIRKAVERADEMFSINTMGVVITIDDKKYNEYVLCLPSYDGAIDSVTLAHEVSHLSFFILSDRGVEIYDGGENEPFCYLQSFIMQQIIDLL